MPAIPSSQVFDFTQTSESLDGEVLRQDVKNIHKLKTLEDVEILLERVKIMMDDIECALAVNKAEHFKSKTDYEDWKRRTEYCLLRFGADRRRVDGYRRRLAEQKSLETARRNRLQENLIAAERKRDEASVNAIFQLSKNLGFIEALKKRGIIPPDVWREVWDEGEQIAFDRRREHEGVTYRKLDSYIARLRRELDAEGIEDSAPVDGTPNAG